MPTVDGLSFSYVLHELPPGRLPFRRWRFELWHGARLEAAGWRMSERDASPGPCAPTAPRRARHVRAGPPAVDELQPAFRPGAAVRVHHGAITFSLVPRNLDRPELLTSLAS